MSRTLVLTHEYWPYRGGVARYLYNLFSAFDKSDYLILTDSKASLGDNVQLTKFRYGFSRPTWLPAVFKIMKTARHEKIDTIFTPNILPLGSLAYAIFRLTGIHYIISLHGFDIRLAMKNKPRWTRNILENAKYIVVNSENTKAQLKPLNISDSKIVLIYPNIEIKKADPDTIERIRNEQNLRGKKVLLSVGRLVKRKGHHLVLRALAEMDTENIKYISVGNGPELGSLRRLRKELNLEGKVRFLTEVSEADLPSYYGCSDIFVLPNILTAEDVEGFGIVFLEAASFSLPIIAGRNGGVLEILSDESAKLVNTSGHEGVKEALVELLNNDKIAGKLASQAHQLVGKFTKIEDSRNALKNIL